MALSEYCVVYSTRFLGMGLQGKYGGIWMEY